LAPSKTTTDALARLAAAEQKFLAGEFLAPALRGGEVHVRIAGVICRLKIKPEDFEGFGIFRPTSLTRAELQRPARLTERQRYLELFPLVRLILAARYERQWLALPAHRGDGRFRGTHCLRGRLPGDGKSPPPTRGAALARRPVPRRRRVQGAARPR
jgi:hypothetical protein